MKSLFPNPAGFSEIEIEEPRTTAPSVPTLPELGTSDLPSLEVGGNDESSESAPQPEDFNVSIDAVPDLKVEPTATVSSRLQRLNRELRDEKSQNHELREFLEDHIVDALECIDFWNKTLNKKDNEDIGVLRKLNQLGGLLKSSRQLEVVEATVERIQQISFGLVEKHLAHIEGLNRKVESSKQEISSLKLSIANLKAELKETHKSFAGSVQEKNERINTLNKNLKQLVQVQDACEAQRKEIEVKLDNTLKELETAIQNNEADEAEIERLNVQASTYEAQIAQLKDPMVVATQENVTKGTNDVFGVIADIAPGTVPPQLLNVLNPENDEKVAKLEKEIEDLKSQNVELKDSNSTLKKVCFGIGLTAVLGGSFLVYKNKQ